MQKYIETLKKFPIFSGLSGSQLEKICAILKKKNFREGQVILKEGERGDDMFLLLKGSVEVSKTLTLMVERGSVDRRNKSLIHLSANDFPCFGEMALLDNSHKRTATIKTQTDCIVGIITRDACITLCENDSLLGYIFMRNIGKAIAGRLDRANKDVLKLTSAFSLALQ